jgi:hypothetical protein
MFLESLLARFGHDFLDVIQVASSWTSSAADR